MCAVLLEEQAGNRKDALFVLSKALKESPLSGELWALAVELEPKNTRMAKIKDALEKCRDDPSIIVSVGKLFWRDRKHEKARKWFERAIALNTKIGDSWAYYYEFLAETMENS